MADSTRTLLLIGAGAALLYGGIYYYSKKLLSPFYIAPTTITSTNYTAGVQVTAASGVAPGSTITFQASTVPPAGSAIASTVVYTTTSTATGTGGANFNVPISSTTYNTYKGQQLLITLIYTDSTGAQQNAQIRISFI